MTALLKMTNITKSFHGVKVLHGVDFSIDKGEVMALCGENGAGKSTLMKILMGIYPKDSGRIVFDGVDLDGHNPLISLQQGIAMIHQELNLVESLTIAQNIFLGREPRKPNGLIDYEKMNALSQELMANLNEDIRVTTKVEALKLAQKQIVEIAKAVSTNCKLMIMDEPTAVLTDRETEMLFELIRKLKKQGVAIIYISHRLGEVKEICDKVTILRDGALVATKDVAEVTEHQIANLMVGREIEDSVVEPFSGDEEDVALEVLNVSDGFLKDVSFRVRRGEVVGFFGLVGAGRTELMEYIFGLRKARQGSVYLNGKEVSINSPADALRNGIGFVTEDRKKTGLVLIRSIADNINYCYLIEKVKAFFSRGQLVDNARTMIDRLKIVCVGPKQSVQDLSGGNQQKVVLSKWLLVDSEILILDEPTRGIDVGARGEIYEIIKHLAKQGKSVIVVSSDLPEILKICQRVVVMYEGRITGELIGKERTENSIMTLAYDLQQAK